MGSSGKVTALYSIISELFCNVPGLKHGSMPQMKAKAQLQSYKIFMCDNCRWMPTRALFSVMYIWSLVELLEFIRVIRNSKLDPVYFCLLEDCIEQFWISLFLFNAPSLVHCVPWCLHSLVLSQAFKLKPVSITLLFFYLSGLIATSLFIIISLVTQPIVHCVLLISSTYTVVQAG